MNFGDLKTKAADYIKRTDLTAIVPTFIQIAQRKIERQYNFKYMETRATTASLEAYLTMPARFKELIWFKVKDGDLYYGLTHTQPVHALSLYPDLISNIGRPAYVATMTNQNEFLIRPTPDKSYTFDIYYYNYSAELSADADTNWLTNNAWELLLYGAMIEAEIYMHNDERIMTWATLLSDTADKLLKAEKLEQLSGSHLEMTSEYIV